MKISTSVIPEYFCRESSLWIFILMLFVMTGCQTTPQKSKTTQAETVSALTTMTEGLTNKPITDAELKNLAQQVARDPQAQSALHSINTALSAQHTVKYCPEDGTRYSPDLIYCPDGKVKLEWLE